MNHEIIKWTARLRDGYAFNEGTVRIEKDGEFELVKVNLQAAADLKFCADDALEFEIAPAQQPDTILAIYLFKDWWTRPAFCKSWAEIPKRTYWILTKTADEYTAYMALPGAVHRAGFSANNKTLKVILSAYMETSCMEEVSVIAVSDSNPYHCMKKLMTKAAEIAKIPTREDREYPAMFEKIGWCSWDAFYQEITEEKVLAKIQEIREKDIPFGWILLDDGWHNIVNNQLHQFSPNPAKFPRGLAPVAAEIRERIKAEHVGIWHAFTGYWDGIAEGGEVFKQEQENLIPINDNHGVPYRTRTKPVASSLTGTNILLIKALTL